MCVCVSVCLCLCVCVILRALEIAVLTQYTCTVLVDDVRISAQENH